MSLFKKNTQAARCAEVQPDAKASGPRPLLRPAGFADLSSNSILYTESIRSIADDDSFGYLDQADAAMRARHGRGFHSVLIDELGRVVSPAHLDVRSASFDRSSDRMAMAAHISAVGFGLSGALDVGALDGSTGPWLETGIVAEDDALILPAYQLYLGQPGEQRVGMQAWTGNISGVSLSPDGHKHVAYCEWRGHDAADQELPGLVWIQDLQSGNRRLLTIIESFSGGEDLVHSPDGAWLLVTGGRPPMLIEVATGRHFEVPVIGYGGGWFPQHGPSSIAMARQTESGVDLIAFDLAANEVEVLGPVEALEGMSRRYLTNINVAADGQQALCVTPLGAHFEYADRHGVRGKVCLLDMASRRLETLTATFLDESFGLERVQSAPHWATSTSALGPVVLHEKLDIELREPFTALAPGAAQFVGVEANEVLVHCMRSLGGERGVDDPPRFRVEFIRSLAAMREFWPDRYEEFREGVTQFVGPNFLDALRSGNAYLNKAWTGIATGEQGVRDGTLDAYDWDGFDFI